MSDRKPIPFVVPDITDAEVEAVTRVLRNGWLTTGPECELLEAELAAYLGIPHVVAMSSCTAALETAYAFLRLPPGARVGVPTWTFVASALAPAKHGAQPVLLDIDDDSLNLSPDSLAVALDEGLDAVVAVHFGGVPDSKEVHTLCADAQVPLVEDAAHALGASDHRGRALGTTTAGACFSFYATKNLTSGEGGALATDDPELDRFARSFRLHGLSRDAWRRYEPDRAGEALYDLEMPGIKGNLPDLLAAVARVQLARFDEMQTRRRRLLHRYRRNLDDVEGLGFVPRDPDDNSADHLLVVTLPGGADREEAARQLAAVGIGSSVHFKPLHSFRWFADHASVGPSGLRNADALAPRVLSLPLHSRLTDDEVDRVCEVLVASLS